MTDSDPPSLARSVGARGSAKGGLRMDGEMGVALAMLAAEVDARGGRLLVVGGSVRDMCLGAEVFGRGELHDLDVEVYGMDPSDLAGVVHTRFDRVDRIGEEYGVLKVLRPSGEYLLDVSLPRTERSTGPGHDEFEVRVDPFLDFEVASRRRDFTVNAMGFDPLTHELLDPHGGQADIQARTLRHVDAAFVEDPLRVLRSARFAARFGYRLDGSTISLCRSMQADLESLPLERVWGELRAALREGRDAGEYFRVLDLTDALELHPEVAALRGVAQDPTWHPEGDVFIHTAHVLDYWSRHLRTGNASDDLVVALAALCHDFGKPATTSIVDGRVRAHGHEAAGVEPARSFLASLGQSAHADQVVPLVQHHLAPMTLQRAGGASDRAVRRLAARVGRIDLLVRVCEADQGGRPPLTADAGRAAGARLMEQASRLGSATGRPKPLVSGHDLLELGLKPGPVFGKLLAAIYEEQLDGHVTTGIDARERLRQLVAACDADN